MDNDHFKQALQERINSYRQVEQSVAAKLGALQTEFETLRDRREAAEKVYEAEFGELRSDQEPQPTRRITTDEIEPTYPEGPLTGTSWENAIETVLRDAGIPLHVSEIKKRLLEGGFRTTSKDPQGSIVAIAVRSTRLVKAGTNVYGLVEFANEPFGQTALSDGLA